MNCFPSGLDNGGFEPVHQNLAYVSADEIESLRVKYHKYNLKFLHGDYVRVDVLLRETEIFRGLTGEQIGKILRISRKAPWRRAPFVL